MILFAQVINKHLWKSVSINLESSSEILNLRVQNIRYVDKLSLNISLFFDGISKVHLVVSLWFKKVLKETRAMM